MNRKLIAFVLGLCFVVISLEFGLRLFSSQHPNQTELTKSLKETPEFILVTLGNSHTFGVGTQSPSEESYPAQLENLLNKTSRRQVIVRNLAGPNLNTTDIYQALKFYLAQELPDFVTIRVGEPNLWNAAGYQLYLKSQQQTQSSVYSLISQLRIFRLIEHVTFQLQLSKNETRQLIIDAETILGMRRVNSKKHLEASIPAFRENHKKTLEAYLDLHPDDLRALNVLASMAYETESYEEGLNYHLKLFEQSQGMYFFALHELDMVELKIRNKRRDLVPLLDKVLKTAYQKIRTRDDYAKMQDFVFKPERLNKDNAHLFIQRSKYFLDFSPGDAHFLNIHLKALKLLKKYDEAFDAAIRGALNNPALVLTLLDTYQQALKNNPEVKKKFVKFSAEFEQKYGMPFDYADHEEKYLEWVFHDIKEITALLREKQIPFVLLNYPPPIRFPSRKIDRELRRFAAENDYPFIDSAANLKKRFDKMPYPKDLYLFQDGSDDHLNEAGYRFLAEELAQYLLENDIVPKSKDFRTVGPVLNHQN